MNQPWMKWTFLEALTKTASKLLQKVIGLSGASFGHSALATAVVGLVQVIGGYIMVKKNGVAIANDSRKNIVGACLFGFFATLATVLSFFIFTLGGDIGVSTFIITLSIVPGALIDQFIFGHKLNGRKWLGVLTAIFAGYSILGWPPLREIVRLPAWVYLSFALTFSVAINQGITQSIRSINPFAKNFWGGLTTLVLSLLMLLFVKIDDQFLASMDISRLLLGSAAIGLIVIFMWSFNLFAYKDGAQIAIKKLVMNGSYLTTAMIFGVILFGEPLTTAKVVGVLFYLAGFSLMDDATWKVIRRR